METIEEAKDYLRSNFDKGTDCPCCGQRVQLYNYNFNAGMARLMIEFRRTDGWIHVINHFKSMGINPHAFSYGKLKWWKLVEKQGKNNSSEKNASGYWRITQKGRDWVDMNIEIHSHAKFYNNRFYGYDGDMISIKDALRNKFNYAELMGYTESP